ncbi:hypothetical protein HDU93_009720 [Gonapodya sp. JEL0774]|nr:hypothetical protein HDU93_009720 [Gonapodya sp. JEL0774]
MNELPDEIFECVFAHIAPRTLYTVVPLTSRRWNRVYQLFRQLSVAVFCTITTDNDQSQPDVEVILSRLLPKPRSMGAGGTGGTAFTAVAYAEVVVQAMIFERDGLQSAEVDDLIRNAVSHTFGTPFDVRIRVVGFSLVGKYKGHPNFYAYMHRSRPLRFECADGDFVSKLGGRVLETVGIVGGPSLQHSLVVDLVDHCSRLHSLDLPVSWGDDNFRRVLKGVPTHLARQIQRITFYPTLWSVSGTSPTIFPAKFSAVSDLGIIPMSAPTNTLRTHALTISTRAYPSIHVVRIAVDASRHLPCSGALDLMSNITRAFPNVKKIVLGITSKGPGQPLPLFPLFHTVPGSKSGFYPLMESSSPEVTYSSSGEVWGRALSTLSYLYFRIEEDNKWDEETSAFAEQCASSLSARGKRVDIRMIGERDRDLEPWEFQGTRRLTAPNSGWLHT